MKTITVSTPPHGFPIYFALTPCVLLISRTWVSRGFLAFSFLGGMVSFVWLYHADGSGQLKQSSRLFWIITNPFEGLRSYLGLVGNPLAYCFGSSRVKLAPIVGGALLIAFCHIVRRRYRWSVNRAFLSSLPCGKGHDC